MVKPPNNLFKERAKKLKSLGINFDLRKPPTDYDKRRARELYKRYSDILQHPENYSVHIVSKETAKKIDCDSARRKTKKKVKLYIPNEGGQVKIGRDKTVKKIIHGGAITKKVFKGGKDIFKTAEKLFKKVNPNDPMMKTYVMVSIGGHAPFTRVFRTLAELQWYLGNWEPKDTEGEDEEIQEQHKQYLIRHMNLVTVKEPAGWFKDGNEGITNAKKKRKKKSRRY